MDILDIRTMLRTRSIYDIPLRVTFYARVSTDSDEQLNSLDNQISYYENFTAFIQQDLPNSVVRTHL